MCHPDKGRSDKQQSATSRQLRDWVSQ